ncbi:MAG: protein-glutamate O-methyltransferase CheR [Gemmatimonadales bacterium]
MTAATETALDRIHRRLADAGAGSLTRFKSGYFERRLRTRFRARAVADPEAYADLLDTDPDESRRLVSALAIGVTGFFRNPSAWRRLGELVAAEGRGGLRAWSAGCATGEEAWSLGLLLDGIPSLGGQWTVQATDLDDRSLAVARGGDYPARVRPDIEAVRDPGIEAAEPDRYRVPAALRERVRFARADLCAAPPAAELDLVLCRNVLIYFTADAQERILEGLLSSLRVGGLLMLGKAELAGFAFLPRLEIADRAERLYRRIA